MTCHKWCNGAMDTNNFLKQCPTFCVTFHLSAGQVQSVHILGKSEIMLDKMTSIWGQNNVISHTLNKSSLSIYSKTLILH